MKLVAFLFKYSRGISILAVLVGFASGVCNSSLVAVTHQTLIRDERRSPYVLFYFLILAVAVPTLRFTSQLLLTKLSQKGIYDLRLHLSRLIAKAQLRRLEEVGSGKLMAVMTEDIQTITNTFSNLPVLCMQTAVVIGCLSYMTWLSWPGVLLVLVVMAVGVSIFRYALTTAWVYMNKARGYTDKLIGHYRGLYDGAKELKLHRQRREAFVSQEIGSTAEALRHSNVTAIKIMSLSSGSYQILFFSLIGTILFVMPKYMAVDAYVLTGYTLAIFYLLIPFEDLTGLLQSGARANIALRRIESLGLSLEEDTKQKPAPAPTVAGGSWRELEMVGVTHKYFRESDNSSFVLGPLNLKFQPGELTFLIGGNGSGKTTLAKLLTGLYLPETGQISLDGQPVTEETQDEYRQMFSVVFFDFYLFDSLLGLESEKLDARAKQYLTELQLDHKLQVTNGKFSSTDLSQGQRKRIALLTAFLENRPFYIFDEWAADQDPVFREIFYLQILPELKAQGKSILVISHDDRYYHLGDRIIKLDYGKVEYDRHTKHRPIDSLNTVAVTI